MNYEDVRKVLTVLRINYPNSFKNLDKEDRKAYLDLWATAFKDDDGVQVLTAVKSIIYTDTREFAPNIGQVKNKMYELAHQGEMTEQEAWNIIAKAIRRSAYHSVEEFEKLPPMLQRLVGSSQQLFNWSQSTESELETVIASNFMRSYRNRSKIEKDIAMLPNDIKELIGTTNIKMIGADYGMETNDK